MNGENPNEYVAALKRSGAGDEAVTTILRNAGWPEKEAVAALASYYETVTGMAVPSRRRSAGGPKDAFLHLLSFLTLATWCIAAGSLWFTLIDSWFPDPAAAPVFSDPLAAMAWNLASVLVGFPVFLLVMRIVWRELQSQRFRWTPRFDAGSLISRCWWLPGSSLETLWCSSRACCRARLLCASY